jgi:hypothetical protein
MSETPVLWSGRAGIWRPRVAGGIGSLICYTKMGVAASSRKSGPAQVTWLGVGATRLLGRIDGLFFVLL